MSSIAIPRLSHATRVTAMCAAVGAGLCCTAALAQSQTQQLSFATPRVFCTVTGDPSTACQPTAGAGLAVGDVLGSGGTPDGLPDVAVANEIHNSISVFRNTGDWSPAGAGLVLDRVYFLLGEQDPTLQPLRVEFADMNNDDHLDLV